MIDHFLRPPRGAAEVSADSIRAVGLLSLVAAAIWWGWQDVAVFALVLLGLLVPRALLVRPLFDAMFGLTLIVAAWSATFDLYTSVVGWDIVIHFLANGVIAGMTYLVLSRLGVVPDANDARTPYAVVIVLTVAFGLAAGSLWEMAEWAGHTFLDRTIFVTYDDTIGDMAAGGLGALIAGGAMRLLVPRTDAAVRLG